MSEAVVSDGKKSARHPTALKVFGMGLLPMEADTNNVSPSRIQTLMKKHFQKMKLPKGVTSVVELAHQGRQERAVGR
jgi:hypothetical protein